MKNSNPNQIRKLKIRIAEIPILRYFSEVISYFIEGFNFANAKKTNIEKLNNKVSEKDMSMKSPFSRFFHRTAQNSNG